MESVPLYTPSSYVSDQNSDMSSRSASVSYPSYDSRQTYDSTSASPEEARLAASVVNSAEDMTRQLRLVMEQFTGESIESRIASTAERAWERYGQNTTSSMQTALTQARASLPPDVMRLLRSVLDTIESERVSRAASTSRDDDVSTNAGSAGSLHSQEPRHELTPEELKTVEVAIEGAKNWRSGLGGVRGEELDARIGAQAQGLLDAVARNDPLPKSLQISCRESLTCPAHPRAVVWADQVQGLSSATGLCLILEWCSADRVALNGLEGHHFEAKWIDGAPKSYVAEPATTLAAEELSYTASGLDAETMETMMTDIRHPAAEADAMRDSVVSVYEDEEDTRNDSLNDEFSKQRELYMRAYLDIATGDQAVFGTDVAAFQAVQNWLSAQHASFGLPDKLHNLDPIERETLAGIYTESNPGSICLLDEPQSLTVGRLIFELSDTSNLAKVVENFSTLCAGTTALGRNKKGLHYKSIPIHRFVKGFVMQGGDVTRKDGSGGESIYGSTLPDPKPPHAKHSYGSLSMASSSAKNSSTSQFFICLCEAGSPAATKKLDGKYYPFGTLVEGEDVLRKLESMVETDKAERPLQKVWIEDCGIL